MGWTVLRHKAARLFDSLERRWERPRTQRRLANLLIAVFLGGLVVIELRRRGWLPDAFDSVVSASHFQALHVAFTLLLLYEVIALVFGLAQSVARAAGMQFEIMSLILIRQSFKELKGMPEPIDAEAVKGVIHYILSDAIGALLIFMVLIVYYRIQRHTPISADESERAGFINSKKLVALVLLLSLVVLGVMQILSSLEPGGGHFEFFAAFYTVLIFADVLIVLLSMRYSTAYPVVFRYFGFAVATVLVRLALTAPRIWDAALGLAGVLFALALAWAYNHSALSQVPRTASVGEAEEAFRAGEGLTIEGEKHEEA